MRTSAIPTGRTAPWTRPRHCGRCQMASPTWIISGSGGTTARVASSTNIAWWHRFSAPTLHAQLAALPWRQVPAADDTRERGHGRDERRTLKITAVAAGLAFPHAAQAIQIVRRRKLPGKKKWSRETVYAITSLTATQASPAELAAIIRGHWMIEDRLHWVRDMDFDEDRSQIRTGSGPRVMASLRNLVLAILRLTGAISIAAACATTPADRTGHYERS